MSCSLSTKMRTCSITTTMQVQWGCMDISILSRKRRNIHGSLAWVNCSRCNLKDGRHMEAPQPFWPQDKWFEEFPISEEDLPYFLPGSSDDWTKAAAFAQLGGFLGIKWAPSQMCQILPNRIFELHRTAMAQNHFVGFCRYRTFKIHCQVSLGLLDNSELFSRLVCRQGA